jgi:hypothetical protein
MLLLQEFHQFQCRRRGDDFIDHVCLHRKKTRRINGRRNRLPFDPNTT